MRNAVLFPLFLLSLICTFTFAACTPKQTPPPPPQVSPSVPVEDTLRLLYWQAPTTLNPHLAKGLQDFDGARLVYEPLASRDRDNQLVLFLAAEVPTVENGGIAADGKSVTWKLKPDVQWSDGKPFTAEDVAFTYEFLSNPDVAAVTTASYEAVEKVEALDPRTVKVTFKQVTPGWSVPFTGQNGMILPKHIFAAEGGDKTQPAPANQMPVGTGPYKVVQFNPGRDITLEPNELYWDGDSPIERVEVKGGGDAVAAARSVLKEGSADFANNLQVEAQFLKSWSAEGKGQLSTIFGPYVERIAINFTDPNQATPAGERSSTDFPHPFLSDKRVRQAFNLAIDRDTIAKTLYGDNGRPTAQLLVAPESVKSDRIAYEFNLAKAAALLKKAGWVDTNKDGVRDRDGVEMRVVFATAANSVRQQTQEIVKQALESIGVSVELKRIEAASFFSGDPSNPSTINHFYSDLQEYSTGNDSPDPIAYMKWWTCDEVAQAQNNWQKPNYSRYCNPEYDALWQQAATELNGEKRDRLFQQMDELLAEDVAVIPIIHRANVNGTSNRLEGVEPTPWDANTWNIRDWKLKKIENRTSEPENVEAD